MLTWLCVSEAAADAANSNRIVEDYARYPQAEKVIITTTNAPASPIVERCVRVSPKAQLYSQSLRVSAENKQGTKP